MPSKKRSKPPKPNDTPTKMVPARDAYNKQESTSDVAKYSPRQKTTASSAAPTTPEKGHHRSTAEFTTPTTSSASPSSKQQSSRSHKGQSSPNPKKGHSSPSGKTKKKSTPSATKEHSSSPSPQKAGTLNERKAEQRDSSSGSSSSTASSDAPVISQKARKIIVSNRVNRDLSISFYVNVNQRPETLLEGQGDHTTSYIAIIQALLSSTNLISVSNAIRKIKRFGFSILKKDDQKYLEQFKPMVIHEHIERRNAQKALKIHAQEQRSPKISQTYPPRASRSLKYAKISAKGNDLCDLAEYILNAAQKQELATFYSNGRTNKKINEGGLAKNAARALLALNKLCYIDTITDLKKLKKEITKLSDGLNVRSVDEIDDEHVYRYGISVLNGLGKNGLGAADKFIENLSDTDDPLSVVRNEIGKYLLETDKIAEYIGDLLDYHRELDFTVTKSNKAFGINFSVDGKSTSREKVETFFSKNNHTIDLSYPDGVRHPAEIKVSIIRNDEDSLIQVIDNHLKVITEAYPVLVRRLQKEGKMQKVCEYFLSCKVLEEQGWSKHNLAQQQRAQGALTCEKIMQDSQAIQTLINPTEDSINLSTLQTPSPSRPRGSRKKRTP